MATKIDFFFDYQCPYAWTAQRWIWQVKDELGDELQINWRFFSIEQVNKKDEDPNLWDLPNDGQHSNMRAFQGALAALKQGDESTFRAFHSAIYNHRHESKRNIGTDRLLIQTAEEAGLDVEQFKADLDSDEAFTKLKDDFTSAKETLGVFGVPTIVFENGQSAYLKIRIGDLPKDPVGFWNEFVGIVRDRDNILEIKRPTPPKA